MIRHVLSRVPIRSLAATPAHVGDIPVSWNSWRLVTASTVRLTAVLTVVLAAVLSATASTAYGQIRSDWAPFDARYPSYTTSYECRAAVARTSRIASGLQDYDTFSVRAITARLRVSKETKATVEQCLRRIVIDSLPRLELMPMMGLYLLAGRDKDAEAMVQRMLNGQWKPVPTDTVSALRAAYFDGPNGAKHKAIIHHVAATTYLNAVPARFSAAFSHVDAVERLGTEERSVLVSQYYAIFRMARDLGDSAVVRRSSQRIVDIGKNMGTSERQNVAGLLFAIRQHVTAQTRFDSLRLNTEAYVALQKKQLHEFDAADRLLGTPMDSLQGEFRFPAAPVSPTPGKITVVVVPGARPLSPYTVFPMLRRLKQKHTDLEILFVSRTGGQWGTHLFEPAQHAEMQRRWVQDFLKMPFSVLIEQSKPWRLPDPDRRLIYGTTPNTEKYRDRLWLVDRAGTIVYYAPISREPEAELDQLIAVLRQQR